MSKVVPLACSCGAVKGELNVVPGDFFHVACLCCDCQAFAAQLGREDFVLDSSGGSELFQTYPAYFKITEGAEHIRALQLKPKGLFRWYTACCNTPLANTMKSAHVPFVGLSVKLMQFDSAADKSAAIGPVTLRAFGKHARGPMPADAHATFPKSFLPKILKFMGKGLLLGKSRPSPLFKGGKPVAEIEIVS
ncbi:DUF6151 family protein [Teredinibacter turnerae]|uniref:DUF6151 family protein n=1 Tax=Teredinibacter turnerae TaxID=2426 RepID=UPI0003726F91|nr:DUF6151 family protein [Teredinibacter turnerae]